MKREGYDFRALVEGMESYIGASKLKGGLSFEDFDLEWERYGLGDSNLSRTTELQVYRRLIHKWAGGKSYERDKAVRAKNVTRDMEEYQKRGAARIDLEGIDTPKGGFVKLRVKFNVLGKDKRGRTRYGSDEVVKVRGKPQKRLRGKDGRFLKRIR